MLNFNNDTLFSVLSTASIIFYSIVYVPQFLLIYQTKTSSGISIWTLLLWTQADVLSLIGTIILYMNTNIILIGWYHFSIGILMIFYVLFYKEETDNVYIYQCVVSSINIMINLSICILLHIFISKSYDTIGEIIGWITMSLYLFGRLPQIWLNYTRKSTDGLSLLMYIFTILGNTTYIAVITVDPETIRAKIPWIVTAILSSLLDIFTISQHYYYNTNDTTNDTTTIDHITNPRTNSQDQLIQD